MGYRHVLAVGIGLALGGEAFSDDKPEDISALEKQVLDEFGRLSTKLKRCGEAAWGNYPKDSRSAEVYGDVERPIEYTVLIKVPEDAYFYSDASYPPLAIAGVKEVFVTYQDRKLGLWKPVWGWRWFVDPNATGYGDRIIFDVLHVDHDKWPRRGWDYAFELFLSWPDQEDVDTWDSRRGHLETALQNIEMARKNMPKRCKKR